MRGRRIVIAFAICAVLLLVGVVALGHLFGNGIPPGIPEEPVAGCTVTADGEASLSLEQMANAATIVAVGIRRDVPERGQVVALAAALQESKLRNLDFGDRDSVGLFQQRPSQGWGTAKQIADPRYAAGKFFAALLRVHDWERMSVTEAAQAVQRSGAPDAYQQWAAEAGILAHALVGDDSAAVACTLTAAPDDRGSQALAALATNMHLDWGSGVGKASTTQPGTFVVTAPSSRTGWQYAHWLVAHAQDSGVFSVTYGGLRWTAGSGVWAAPPTPSATVTLAPAAAQDDATSGRTVIAQVFA